MALAGATSATESPAASRRGLMNGCRCAWGVCGGVNGGPRGHTRGRQRGSVRDKKTTIHGQIGTGAMLLFDMETFNRFRTAAVIVSIASLGAGAAVAADQETERKRGLKKGDTITVTGCLQGSLLQSTEVTGEDGVPVATATYSFQLKGKKELLKDMREKHDGFVVSLTGELKSTLTDESLFQHEDWRNEGHRGRRSADTRAGDAGHVAGAPGP